MKDNINILTNQCAEALLECKCIVDSGESDCMSITELSAFSEDSEDDNTNIIQNTTTNEPPLDAQMPSEEIKNFEENIKKNYKYFLKNNTITDNVIMCVYRDFVHIKQSIISEVLSKSDKLIALEYLEKHPNMINGYCLSANPSPYAINLLRKLYKHPKYNYIVNWSQLSKNSSEEAVKFLNENSTKINWKQLCLNTCPLAIDVLGKNINKIYWIEFCKNPAPEAIELMKKYMYKIIWSSLALNPSPHAIEILRNNSNIIAPNRYQICWNLAKNHTPEALILLNENKNIYTINDGNNKIWYEISRNPSPTAIDMLTRYPQYINWVSLALNPSEKAVKLLLDNLHYMNWDVFCCNSSDLAYEILKKNSSLLNLSQISGNSSPKKLGLLLEYEKKLKAYIKYKNIKGIYYD